MLLACAVFAAGCGSSGGGSDGDTPTPSGSLLPWSTGNTWTYRTTDDTGVFEKVTTIGQLEPVGAGPNAELMAFKVVTRKGANLMDQTESWQAPLAETPERIVRYRELSYGAQSGALELDEYWDPYKIHIDGSTDRLVRGQTWLESYIEHKVPQNGTTPTSHEARDLWTVVSVDEVVEVPAGRFEHAVHLQKSPSAKDYWYVRGIGKVKESGGQLEELVSYSVDEVEQ
jgi:hypothetical protein